MISLEENDELPCARNWAKGTRNPHGWTRSSCHYSSISRKCTGDGNRVRAFAINIERLSEYVGMRQGRSRPICSVAVHSYTCMCLQRVCVRWQHILSAGIGSVLLSPDTQAWKTHFLQRFKDFHSMSAYCQSKTILLWQIMTHHSCSSE